MSNFNWLALNNLRYIKRFLIQFYNVCWCFYNKYILPSLVWYLLYFYNQPPLYFTFF